MSIDNLTRFLDAQQRDYGTALKEIKSGHKRSHWMWYIFPQIAGLGFSEMAKRYAIDDMAEAKAYLTHPVLGKRIKEISAALLGLDSHNATQVMGKPDDLKLRSSMTLFALVEGTDSVFDAVLKKFFDGQKDPATVQLIC
ncbi:calpastatin [Mucilaginibacter sp. PAMC 26640]|nr:calpastatin [Mucilaginibacter sp. PAMC 26640]